MIVLVLCEESQVICKAFREKGHEAYSCDLQECSGGNPEWHFQMDAFEAFELLTKKNGKIDLIVACVPCTFLSSVQTFRCRKSIERTLQRIRAAQFFMQILNLDCPKIAIENPSGVMKHIYREPDQTIHPFYFGLGDYKRTCLWLKGLPKLIHTKATDLFETRTHTVPPEPTKVWVQKSTGKTKYQRNVNRPFISGKERSKLSPSIAKAMAEQWG